MTVMLSLGSFANTAPPMNSVTKHDFKECGQIFVSQSDKSGFPLVDGIACPVFISKTDGKTVKKIA